MRFKKLKTKSKNHLDFNNKCLKCTQNQLLKMNDSGRGKKQILIISDFPTKIQLGRSTLLTGNEYGLLHSTLSQFGINLIDDCIWTTSIQCTPNYEGKKKSYDIGNATKSCYPHINKLIFEYKPKLIITLGDYSARSILKQHWKGNVSPEVLRGYTIPLKAWNCHWIPTVNKDYQRFGYHPETVDFYMRHDISTGLQKTTSNGVVVNKAILSVSELQKRVKVLQHPVQIKSVLERFIMENKPTAFDYEATGIKLHRDLHKIYSMSLCNNTEEAFSFLITPEVETDVIKFLSSDVQKECANKNYEQCASVLKYQQWVKNINWDTMLCQHVLDAEGGSEGDDARNIGSSSKSVKFLSFLLWGITDYSKDVKSYFQPISEEEKLLGDNTYNKIEQCPVQKLLVYGGMDALLEKMNAEWQQSILLNQLSEEHDFNYMENNYER